MRIVCNFYHNLDRLIKANKFSGWLSGVVVHFWIIRMVLVLAFGPDRSEALDYALFALGFYVLPVTFLDLREARDELARLKSEYRDI